MEMFIKTTMQPFFYWLSQPQLLWEAFPLLHMLWQSFVCMWCVCLWCSRSLIGCQTAKSEPEHVWPDSRHPRLHWPGRRDLYKGPPHTLRKSANTSKLARRTYALHPQVRTKLAIQKNKHNHNKHAVWTSLQMPLALSACDPLIVEYENKMWYWKREHTKSDKMSLLVNYLCCCYFSRQASSSSCPPFLNHLTSMPPLPLFPAFSLHLNTV